MNKYSRVFDRGFSNPNNILTYSSGIFKGHLYFGTRNLISGGEIYRTDGISCERVASNGFGEIDNIDIFGLVEFKGFLYAGTYNYKGAQIYRSEDGLKWIKIAEGGLRQKDNCDFYSFAEFNDSLFTGTCNLIIERNINKDYKLSTGAEIYKSEDGLRWEKIYKSSTKYMNFIRSFCVSSDNRLFASTGKFNPKNMILEYFNNHFKEIYLPYSYNKYSDIPNIIAFGNRLVLFLGTSGHTGPFKILYYQNGEFIDAAFDGFGSKDNVQILSTVRHGDTVFAITMNYAAGLEIWKSDDGVNWSNIIKNGLDNAHNEYSIYSARFFKDHLWLGVYDNTSSGCLIYKVK